MDVDALSTAFQQHIIYILDLGNLCVAKFFKTDVLHLLPQGHRSHLGTHRVIFQSVELAAQSQHRDSDLPPLG